MRLYKKIKLEVRKITFHLKLSIFSYLKEALKIKITFLYYFVKIALTMGYQLLAVIFFKYSGAVKNI